MKFFFYTFIFFFLSFSPLYSQVSEVLRIGYPDNSSREFGPGRYLGYKEYVFTVPSDWANCVTWTDFPDCLVGSDCDGIKSLGISFQASPGDYDFIIRGQSTIKTQLIIYLDGQEIGCFKTRVEFDDIVVPLKINFGGNHIISMSILDRNSIFNFDVLKLIYQENVLTPKPVSTLTPFPIKLPRNYPVFGDPLWYIGKDDGDVKEFGKAEEFSRTSHFYISEPEKNFRDFPDGFVGGGFNGISQLMLEFFAPRGNYSLHIKARGKGKLDIFSENQNLGSLDISSEFKDYYLKFPVPLAGNKTITLQLTTSNGRIYFDYLRLEKVLTEDGPPSDKDIVWELGAFDKSPGEFGDFWMFPAKVNYIIPPNWREADLADFPKGVIGSDGSGVKELNIVFSAPSGKYYLIAGIFPFGKTRGTLKLDGNKVRAFTFKEGYEGEIFNLNLDDRGDHIITFTVEGKSDYFTIDGLMLLKSE